MIESVVRRRNNNKVAFKLHQSNMFEEEKELEEGVLRRRRYAEHASFKRQQFNAI